MFVDEIQHHRLEEDVPLQFILQTVVSYIATFQYSNTITAIKWGNYNCKYLNLVFKDLANFITVICYHCKFGSQVTT